ncbi:hypothetical protein CcCBS67573_g02021 [Chytriomyces confervae]|uniref:Hcy-binding domain-containing protein n=1 Tax=Chytriomyces confervae TaxID=246404 RepID=A0A507FJZ1_9FUNG|nr:hypothetical protein CcCBS67573_g02021 [Chytriomyces confervae]
MVVILDGGLSTHLEDLGATISDDALWSAKLLLTDDGIAVVEKAHSDFMLAGADIISTVTYQAFVPTARVTSTRSTESMVELFVKGVEAAKRARDKFMQLHPERSFVRVAVSLGSYGAVLANGAEFTGVFDGISMDDLVEFHAAKLAVAVQQKPDLVAFETIPSVFEARAVVAALEKVSKTTPIPQAWISFSCSSGETVCSGETIEDCVAAVRDSEHVFAVGVNCTKPQFVQKILETYKSGLVGTGKSIMCYPNKGELWDSEKREWVAEDNAKSQETFSRLAQGWIKVGASIVGGCCRISPGHIHAVREQIGKAE